MSCDTGKSMDSIESEEKETVSFTGQDLASLCGLPCFNIMNGNPSDAMSFVFREIMSKTWHWSPIEGLNPEGAIRKTHDFIRQEIARMNIHPEAGVSPTLRRKKGIVIGVARAVSTELYGIISGHIIDRDMDTAKLAVGDDGSTIVVKNDVDSEWKEELSKPLNLSETEKKVISKLHLLAVAMIPLQGYSLITTPYHYDCSMKAFTVVEKQVWAGCDQFSWWWKEDVDALRDALWHKAGHPVKISFKKEIACSNTVKKLLAEAGLQSATKWLPYLEAEVRKAKSYKALLETVLPIFKSWGGDVNFGTLNELLNYLENFPAGRPTEIITVNNAPSHLRSLDTRKKVVGLIEQSCTRNAGKIAKCYGFYMAMAEEDDHFNGAYSLKTSYWLRELKKTNFAYYYLGLEDFLDYKAYKAKQIKVEKART